MDINEQVDLNALVKKVLHNVDQRWTSTIVLKVDTIYTSLRVWYFKPKHLILK